MLPPNHPSGKGRAHEPSFSVAGVLPRRSGHVYGRWLPDLSKWTSVDVRRKVIRSSPFQASLLAKLSDGDLGAYETGLCQELPAQQNSVRLLRLPFFSVHRTMEKLNQWPTEVSKQILQPITLQAKCWCAAFEIGIQATPRNGSVCDAMQSLTPPVTLPWRPGPLLHRAHYACNGFIHSSSY